MLENFFALMLTRRDEEKGATAVEYGLMVALIAVAIIVAVRLLGTELSTLFSGVANTI
jgi:pilus assembly protein Flp/PilA